MRPGVEFGCKELTCCLATGGLNASPMLRRTEVHPQSSEVTNYKTSALRID
jgi:hypothetical protein